MNCGDAVGQEPQIVKAESFAVALVVFPIEGDLIGHSEPADSVTAHPPDVERIALSVSQLALSD